MALAATGGSFPAHGDGDLANAALAIFAEAARRANSLNAQTLSSVLQAQGFDTPVGHVTFDAAGDAIIANPAKRNAGNPNGAQAVRISSGNTAAAYRVVTWNGRSWDAGPLDAGSLDQGSFSPGTTPVTRPALPAAGKGSPAAGPAGDPEAVSIAPR
jgi:hypothetical protein